MLIVLASLVLIAGPLAVKAQTGEIRIEPHGSYYPLPIMLSSPATFNTTATDQATAYNPHIVLIMTNASYQGLTGHVLVNWTGGSTHFPKASFTSVELNGAFVPPSGTTPGARYTVASLKEHLGVNDTADDTLWYAHGAFLSGPINQTPQEFTVTLPSTDPRMLVYIIGMSSATGNLFDMKVPPTMPGFVVPDLAPLLLATASFGALGLYAVKRRKT